METYDELVKSGKLVVNAVHTGSRHRSYSITMHLDGKLIDEYFAEWDDDWGAEPYTPDAEEFYQRWARGQKAKKEE